MALLLPYDFGQSVAKHGNFLTVVREADAGLDVTGATRSTGMITVLSAGMITVFSAGMLIAFIWGLTLADAKGVDGSVRGSLALTLMCVPK